MDYEKLKRPLMASEIDFRVGSISKNRKALILPYKTARVDMDILDEVVGAMNWERKHSRDNHNCTVSIWDSEKKQWVSKEDTGIESYAEKQKGVASDSFKRACYNWGIGRSLYNFPVIIIELHEHEVYKTSNNKLSTNIYLNRWDWHITYKDNIVQSIVCFDDKGYKRFKYDNQHEQEKTKNKKNTPKQEVKKEKSILNYNDNNYKACLDKQIPLSIIKEYYNVKDEVIKMYEKELKLLNNN